VLELDEESEGSELPLWAELSLELGPHSSLELELELEELSEGSELPLEADDCRSSRFTSHAPSLDAEEYVSPICASH